MPPDPARAALPRSGIGPAGLAERLERHARRLGEAETGASGDRLRLVVYTLGLCVAFGLYLLVYGPARGLGFWIPGLAIGAAVTSGIVLRGAALNRLFRWGVIGAVCLVLLIPIAPALLAGEPLAPLVSANPLWPQILVTLFASRVLSEVCDLRFAAFWRMPLRPHAPVQIQSNAAAVALGAFFTLVFYQGVWFLAPERSGGTTLTAIVSSALAGESAIHRPIVFLFFVIVGYVCDAAVHYRRDREALAALQIELASARGTESGAGPSRLRGLLAGPLAPFAHTRTVRFLDEAIGKAGRPARQGERSSVLATDAFDAFHAASRRFVRGLLPFLPLLGFFGTVVGLATAMAALPTGGAGGRIDLSGSLSGLALKFETTLLGILASMIASVLLAVLEKGETELAAECVLLADAAERLDAR